MMPSSPDASVSFSPREKTQGRQQESGNTRYTKAIVPHPGRYQRLYIIIVFDVQHRKDDKPHREEVLAHNTHNIQRLDPLRVARAGIDQ